MKKKELFAFGIALIALSLILLLQHGVDNEVEEVDLYISDEKVLSLEVADTPRERLQGLSGRKSLPEDGGLLFIFDRKDKHGIWMKDMNFPIDIIWLDEKFEVINFKKNVLPSTFPTTFEPTSPSLYVLETNSGIIEELNVKVGQVLDIRTRVIEK